MHGLLKAAELDRTRIDDLIGLAKELARQPRRRLTTHAVVGLMFFEDSLRTRVGFEAAAARLGMSTTNIHTHRHTEQMAVAETLQDTLRSVAPYFDAICLRHPDAGAFDGAVELVDTPVLNCGNGTDEHPTQALVDLFALDVLRGEIDGLRIALVGDLKHMRSAHSLLVALSCYERVVARCISPPELGVPSRYTQRFCDSGGRLEAGVELDLSDLDAVYIAGLPRTPQNGVTIEQQDAYRIDARRVSELSREGLVLCPLPRVDEIAADVDMFAQAAYFRQSELGLGMRMALLKQAIASFSGCVTDE